MAHVSYIRPSNGAVHLQRGYECFIMNVALRHFMEHGYGRTSLADIAHECNITLGTLQDTYEDKETLFRLIVDKETAATREPFVDGIPMFATSMEAIQFVAKIRKLVFETTLLADLTRIIWMEIPKFPELRGILQTPDGQEQSQAMGEHVLKEWISCGLFKECDVPTAVRKLYGMLNHAFLLEPRVIGKEIPNLDGYLQSVCDTFCTEYGLK